MRHFTLSIFILPLLWQCTCPADSTPAQQATEPLAQPVAPPISPVPDKANQNGGIPQYMPRGLCYLDEVVPGIAVNLRYCGNDNFVGRPIDGYTTGKRAILRRDTAECVKKAQKELAAKGLGLLVWDAYRPHRAMKDFYNWSLTDEASQKARFFPNISKRGIYQNKYIGLKSAHSWGTAVDVTIIDLTTGKELDMGTGFDFLDASSATRYTKLTPEQRANRMLLRDTMDRAGMRNYKREWWHYFLKDKGKVTRYDFPLCDTLLPRP